MSNAPAITKLNLNGTLHLLTHYASEDMQLYQGRELSEYTWSLIRVKIRIQDWTDLHIGDYKTITLTDGETVKMQIAGIDTYYNTGIIGAEHHIDFISVDCLKNVNIKWTNATNNNGTSTKKSPYMNSNVQTYLNNTILPKLPTDLKDIITSKKMLMETRYSASGTLTESDNSVEETLGKLWIPTECEVCGATIFGTKGRSASDAVQYPLFANNARSRVKKLGNNGSERADWWLANVAAGTSTGACYMNHMGYPSYHNVTDYSHGVPLCFRIAESA